MMAMLPKIDVLHLHITGRGVWLLVLPFALPPTRELASRPENVNHAQVAVSFGRHDHGGRRGRL
jgi:hypothetical protein